MKEKFTCAARFCDKNKILKIPILKKFATMNDKYKAKNFDEFAKEISFENIFWLPSWILVPF
jgi:hypothetical protein